MNSQRSTVTHKRVCYWLVFHFSSKVCIDSSLRNLLRAFTLPLSLFRQRFSLWFTRDLRFPNEGFVKYPRIFRGLCKILLWRWVTEEHNCINNVSCNHKCRRIGFINELTSGLQKFLKSRHKLSGKMSLNKQSSPSINDSWTFTVYKIFTTTILTLVLSKSTTNTSPDRVCEHFTSDY